VIKFVFRRSKIVRDVDLITDSFLNGFFYFWYGNPIFQIIEFGQMRLICIGVADEAEAMVFDLANALACDAVLTANGVERALLPACPQAIPADNDVL
jgi:hypothetical protein